MTHHDPFLVTAGPAPAPRTLRARWPLALLVTGLAFTGVSIWTDGHYVGDLTDACKAGPGIPWFGVAAAWVGLLLGVAAAIRIAWQVFVAPHRKPPRTVAALRPGVHGAMLAVLVLSIIPLLLQVIAVHGAMGDRGHRRSPCEGLRPVAAAIRG
jgi:hypothetical protein